MDDVRGVINNGMEHTYCSSDIAIAANQEDVIISSETSSNSKTADVEKDQTQLQQFKEGILKDVEGLLKSFLDDRVSVAAPSTSSFSRDYPLDKRNLPEGSPSKKKSRIDVGESYSDLIPRKELAAQNLNEAAAASKLDICEEFLVKFDKEMPESIEYGIEIPENLASRIVGHFAHKSESSDARKIINDRHKLPSNCKEICVPRLRESLLNVKTFNEYAKRSERALYNLQTSVVQSVSCVTDVLAEVISAEENSRVVSSEMLLKNCFDSITLLGHASKTISNLRKKNLKPSLNSQYQILCNPNRNTTQFLLGDDLNKGMQEAQESSKLAKSSLSLERRHSFKGSSSSRPKISNTGGKSFLEKGPKPHSRYKENNSQKHKRKGQ